MPVLRPVRAFEYARGRHWLLQWRSQSGEFICKVARMYSGDSGSFGTPRHELYRLDRVLAQLTRPAMPGADVPAAVRDQLRALGLTMPSSVDREELIAQVWGRKRPLLRQLDDDDPVPPCA